MLLRNNLVHHFLEQHDQRSIMGARQRRISCSRLAAESRYIIMSLANGRKSSS